MVDVMNFITSIKSSIKRLTGSHKPGMDKWTMIFYRKYFILNAWSNKTMHFGKMFYFLLYEGSYQSSKYCYQISYFSMTQLQYKNSQQTSFLNEILVRSKGCARPFLWRCTFLVFGVFQRTYNLSYKCVMHYTSIITVISKYLKILSSNKTLFKRFPNRNIPLFFEYIFLTEKCTRCIYKLLNNNEVVPIPNGRQI